VYRHGHRKHGWSIRIRYHRRVGPTGIEEWDETYPGFNRTNVIERIRYELAKARPAGMTVSVSMYDPDGTMVPYVDPPTPPTTP